MVVAADGVAGPVTANDPALRSDQGVDASSLPSAESDETPSLPAMAPARPLAAPSERASDAHGGRSAAELAAEMLREAGIGVAASAADSGQTRSTVRQAGAAPSSSARPGAKAAEADEEPLSDLRDLGKAAMHWIKDSIPWLRSNDDAAGGASGTGSVEWSGSTLGSGPSRQGAASPVQVTDAAAQAAVTSTNPPSGYNERARQEALQAERNLIRDAIAFLREVLQHPMTWLVISLFVVGGVAMSMADRRPK